MGDVLPGAFSDKKGVAEAQNRGIFGQFRVEIELVLYGIPLFSHTDGSKNCWMSRIYLSEACVSKSPEIRIPILYLVSQPSGAGCVPVLFPIN